MSKPVFSQLDRLARYRDQDMGEGRRKTSRAPRVLRHEKRTVAVDEYMLGEVPADDEDGA